MECIICRNHIVGSIIFEYVPHVETKTQNSSIFIKLILQRIPLEYITL